MKKLGKKNSIQEGYVNYDEKLDRDNENDNEEGWHKTKIQGEEYDVYYGPVKPGQVRFIWISEPGACEKCQSMNGKIFETAEDVPKKPHPNCKCHVEPIKKQVETTDPIEQRRATARENESQRIELEKLQGDATSLLEESDLVETYIDKELESIEQIILHEDFDKLSDSDKEAIQNYKFEIKIYKNDILRAKNEIPLLNLKQSNNQKQNNTNVSNNDVTKKEISFFKFKLGHYKNILQDLPNKIYKINPFSRLRKPIMNFGIKRQKATEYDAVKLWKIAAKKGFENNDYINKNGKVIYNIEDIKETNLREYINTKVQRQLGSTEKKGVWFHEKSSLARAYSNSVDFKEYIRKIKPQLIKNKECPSGSIEFKKGNDKNLYHAIHMSDIVDIKLDKQQNLHAKIFDTYDFNDEGYWTLVGQARILQEHHEIETYYTITDILIPKDVWMNY